MIPVLILSYIFWSQERFGTLRFSSFQLLEGIPKTSGMWRKHALFSIRILALIFLILTLMRPQQKNALQELNAEGIDIMLVIDISGSMRATDFKPNRLEAVKKVAQTFVSQRQNDRIGLNVFARESFMQCPLTTDLTRLNDDLVGKRVEVCVVLLGQGLELIRGDAHFAGKEGLARFLKCVRGNALREESC